MPRSLVGGKGTSATDLEEGVVKKRLFVKVKKESAIERKTGQQKSGDSLLLPLLTPHCVKSRFITEGDAGHRWV